MRHLKITLLMVAPLVLTVLLGLAGCGGDDRDRHHGDRDRSRYERQDNDRHGDRGGDSAHEGDHGDR